MSSSLESLSSLLNRLGINTHNVLFLLSISVGAFILYIASRIFYNIYLHPLSNYPGPKLAAATRLWHIYHRIRGNWIYVTKSLSDTYGPIIRIAPDELAYTDPTAWPQIYGHRSGKQELQKDPITYNAASSGPGSILAASRARHGVLRKQLSHGFSERALRDQDGVIRGYADLCIQRLRERCGKPVDMVEWLNFFTFDVMGDLVFGSPFNCLQNSTYHTWVTTIFSAVKLGSFTQAIAHFPILHYLSPFFIPADLPSLRATHRSMSASKVQTRKSLGAEKPDLISGYLKPDSDITEQELVATSALLIVAGSETTATLMSGALWLLLSNPDKLQKVVEEIRGAFDEETEINLVTVNRLEYLLASLNEALRMYPPVADTLPRKTGGNEEVICGRVVPAHTVVGVHQYATYRSSRNFRDPDSFIPERWLDDPAFAEDNKAALQPFSVGPRNCLGRNLAYFEMRLMMTLFFWNFDVELLPESKDWIDQKAFVLWEKVPLMVRLSPRKI